MQFVKCALKAFPSSAVVTRIDDMFGGAVGLACNWVGLGLLTCIDGRFTVL